ncbi:hypothetical protein [Halobellus ruber]|uniref:Uncharacterized protein n=1 Tax=Halobellus ruber TaxID=2761102 RepID=A0A7J9SJW7_9EURY|nr:hypothetical protein [Halobellus ruber]MBB6647244.1 hypothetical protein [Halobellus ruber]
MATGTHSSVEPNATSSPERRPAVHVCETCPGRAVFVESGNSDGWIATDLTVDPHQ